VASGRGRKAGGRARCAAADLAPADAFIAAVLAADRARLEQLLADNPELARTLLRLSADPNIRDERFDSPPLGWARYFGQQPLAELLEPITEATAE
jgi:hypothetical protein